MTNYDDVNESIRTGVTSATDLETKSALATFCRRNGFEHLFYETLEPVLSRNELVLAIAKSERPWPPKGIGSQRIDAIGMALIGSEGRALVTPVLLDLRHSTNLGLAAAVTKALFETLRERKVPLLAYLVRQGDRALGRALEGAGFARSDVRAATEYADYSAYSAPPEVVLQQLGLNNARLGDVLTLAMDGGEFDRLSAYHFALSAGVLPYLRDAVRYAPLLAGLIELIADLPPGGVPPGTPGPKFGSNLPGER
jgi:hypothetical protein